MNDIITLTMNPALDLSARVGHVIPGRKLRCVEERREPGGGGINVSRVIARMEGSSKAVYPEGGETGTLLSRLLEGEGVDHLPVPTREATRENVMILESETGEQYRFSMPGPGLSEEEWRRCMDAVARLHLEDAFVVASGSLPPGVPADFHAALAAAVNEKGGRLVLDVPGEAMSAALGEGVYLIKPNMREFSEFTGRRLDSHEDQEAAALEIVEKGGAEVVVVSQGAAGTAAVMTPGSELCRQEDVAEIYWKMRSHAGVD